MKYVPSALIGQLSKKQGSTVAAHNRFGSYFRNRVIPVNPRKTLQTFARGVLSGFASLYRALSASDRAAWIALGQSIVRSDSLGQPYTLTGLQAYVSVNRNIRVYGGTAVTTAPVLTVPTQIASVTITAAA